MHKYMKKNTIKLNENQLRQIVAESMKKILKEQGEGIQAMGSAPSESYGKYGELIKKLDEEGDKAIERLLQRYGGMTNGGSFLNKPFNSELVYGILIRFKSFMIYLLEQGIDD